MKTEYRSQKQRGFTLVELLASVAIIAILASIGVGGFRFVQAKGTQKKAEAQLALLQDGLENFKRDHGDYPYDRLFGIRYNNKDTIFPRTTGSINKDRSSEGLVLFLGGGDNTRELEIYVPDLASATANKQNWFPVQDRSYFIDPWGKPWAYHAGFTARGRKTSTGMQNIAGSYDLWSSGEDGQDDTDDDVANF